MPIVSKDEKNARARLEYQGEPDRRGTMKTSIAAYILLLLSLSSIRFLVFPPRKPAVRVVRGSSLPRTKLFKIRIRVLPLLEEGERRFLSRL